MRAYICCMKRHVSAYISVILLVIPTVACAQGWARENDRSGRFYAVWGWNRAQYTASDIHMIGPDYDFILHDVKAYDKPHDVFIDYLNPVKIWIPQNNYGIGYYFRPNLSISLVVDHMKYVVSNEQYTHISGHIYDEHSPAVGEFDHARFWLGKDFMTYEHTDGLNYGNLSLDYTPTIWETNNKKLRLCAYASGGLGLVVPKSNVTLFNHWARDEFALSGWGFHGGAGIRIEFLSHFFVQGQVRGGFIHMWNVRTLPGHRAQQHFGFLEEFATFGGMFRLWKRQEARIKNQD